MPKYKSVAELSKRALKRRLVSTNSTPRIVTEADNTTTVTSQIEDNVTTGNEIHDNDFVIENIESDDEFLSDWEDILDENFDEKPEDISEFLKGWALQYKIKHNALSNILRYLKTNHFPELPIDARTLMQTPKNRNDIEISPGRYVHIGIKENLDNFISNIGEELDEISLDFNIDGVPISRSSTCCFWPILCKPFHRKGYVFTVGIYFGYKKPDSFPDFLRPLVNELKLITEEYLYNERKMKVSVRAFICDTPARAAVTGTKSHCGYYGCNRCTQSGEYLNYRMTFPDIAAVLRTNQSFRNMEDEEHHNYATPILEISSIDMIKQFPMDYLHLVLLGVVKKLLQMWLKGKPPLILSSNDVRIISNKLIDISYTQPKEFQRKIRPLSEIGYFKGSEFRTFLIYSGPFVLKDVLSEEQYNHFLSLHVAIRILCNPEMYHSHGVVAKTLLEDFVTRFGEIYGMDHLVYNVHGLIHLSDDCMNFGTLDSFSAFSFENYMMELKRLLYKNNQQLSQISNRIHEQLNFNRQKISKTQHYPIFKKMTKHENGAIHYEKIVFEDFTLDKSPKNQWFLTRNKQIIRLNFLTNDNNVPMINGFELPYKEDFYKLPLDSSKLDIYRAQNEEREILIPINQISKKLFSMKESTNYTVFFPLIHQTY